MLPRTNGDDMFERAGYSVALAVLLVVETPTSPGNVPGVEFTEKSGAS